MVPVRFKLAVWHQCTKDVTIRSLECCPRLRIEVRLTALPRSNFCSTLLTLRLTVTFNPQRAIIMTQYSCKKINVEGQVVEKIVWNRQTDMPCSTSVSAWSITNPSKIVLATIHADTHSIAVGRCWSMADGEHRSIVECCQSDTCHPSSSVSAAVLINGTESGSSSPYLLSSKSSSDRNLIPLFFWRDVITERHIHFPAFSIAAIFLTR